MLRQFALGAAVFLQTLSAVGQPIPVETIVGQWDPAPGTPDLFAGLRLNDVNDSGDVTFSAGLGDGSNGGQPAHQSVWIWRDASLQPIALPGDPVPESPDDTFDAQFGNALLNEAGEVAFRAETIMGDEDVFPDR